VLTSQLFQNDAVLQAIADDNDRMSRHRHSRGDSARKVQTALLTWDPGALPKFGADGKYGDETAAAVRRFKIEELGVAARDAIDDVGPRTVIRLDEIQAAAERPAPVSTLFVRRDVWTLQAAAPWDPITEAYARAVRTMQARPATDPTSWTFQAAIHATFTTPANPLWNGCQHASWFFLPWHRMYLFFFEKIVRAAVIADGGPADFALPYWNYDQAAPRNTLPLPFREATLPDGSPNPLMPADGLRDRGIAGGAELRPEDTSSTRAMNSTVFTGPGGTAFGGGRSGPALFDGASGLLELQPHNIIHTVLGGPRPDDLRDCSIGQMTHPRCAALDPIFWLHHGNIDRLWNRWLDLAGGRANPADAAWQSQRFSFADETGATVAMSVAEVLDSAAQLKYVYDDRPAVTAPPPIVVPVGPRTELIGATEEVVAVTDRVTVPLTIPASNRSLFFDLARRASGVFLSIEDIEAVQNPGVVFDVLLNQPDADADPRRHRIGSFSLFGIELMNDPDHPHDGAPGLRHTFDIAEVVSGLAALDLWNPDTITVTIEPVPPPAVPGERRLSIEELGLPPVRVGRISLFAQERNDLVS
jgi:Common central domain of tyrosinase/Polyphenol oxidase middle domain